MNRNNKELISIITPTFNRSQFIHYAIRSVITQTISNWELLIIDDGSTDNTKNIIEPYLTDPRIKYFFQENQGQAAARNNGLRHSRGEFVCFLDSDNLWYPEKLKVQHEAMKSRPDIDVVYGDGDTINESGVVISTANMKRYSGRITEKLLKDNFVSFNTAMVRAASIKGIGGFDESVRFGDDYDLWLRLSAKSQFLYIPRVFSQYRVMSDQISSNKEARFSSNEATIKRFLSKNPGILNQRAINRGFSAFYVRRGRYRLGEGEYLIALRDFLKALRYTPFCVSTWRALAKWILFSVGVGHFRQ